MLANWKSSAVVPSGKYHKYTLYNKINGIEIKCKSIKGKTEIEADIVVTLKRMNIVKCNYANGKEK